MASIKPPSERYAPLGVSCLRGDLDNRRQQTLLFPKINGTKGRCFMSKKTRFFSIPILILTILIIFSIAYSEEKGWKKTITLPNGEIVCDLNGVWDYEFDARGELRASSHQGRPFSDVIEITQEGSAFKGIRVRGSSYAVKGEVAVEGEVDKNGIKKMQHHMGGHLASGVFITKLSKDGNKIEINDRNFTVEMSRK